MNLLKKAKEKKAQTITSKRNIRNDGKEESLQILEGRLRDLKTIEFEKDKQMKELDSRKGKDLATAKEEYQKKIKELKNNLEETVNRIKENYEKEKSNVIQNFEVQSQERFQIQRNIQELQSKTGNLDHGSSGLPSVSLPVAPECPICLEEMAPPTRIFQCLNGHHVCGACRQNIQVL